MVHGVVLWNAAHVCHWKPTSATSHKFNVIIIVLKIFWNIL